MYKDFTRAPTHVNTIPVETLDRVKEWLDSVDIAFTEGPLNLNWGNIMKTVIADPHEFFKTGGWAFLSADSDNEDEASEEESAFEMSDSDLAASESESEEESDFDDDASASEDEGDASDLSDEGEDWDELETKAKKEDRNVAMEEDSGKARKRKR